MTHESVLLEETIALLSVIAGKWYIDMTFGRGGHTQRILEQGGNVIALDVDEEAITHGMKSFPQALEKKQLLLVRENFEHVDDVVFSSRNIHQGQIDGALADFGVSSPQIDKASRGFSFQQDAPLDMRMDQRLGVTAGNLVNALGKKELAELFLTYGGETRARAIADRIVSYRLHQPITTTAELANLVEEVVPRMGKLHPATKTFMALRMVVNDELGVIERMLPKAFTALSTGGKLVTISFHEGEDRLCKHFMQASVDRGEAVELTKKPISASDEEVERNVRSRSGKLRGVQKCV